MLTANKLHSDTNNTEGSGERGTKRMRERKGTERGASCGGVAPWAKSKFSWVYSIDTW